MIGTEENLKTVTYQILILVCVQRRHQIQGQYPKVDYISINHPKAKKEYLYPLEYHLQYY